MKTRVLFLMISAFSIVGSDTVLAQIQLGGDIDGESAFDNFGYSISLSSDGQKMAVGASGDDANGNDAGHVRVYEWDGAEWSQIGEDIDGEAANDNSGRGLSLSPDGLRVAIGAYMNDGDGSMADAGQVRIYEWNDNEWIQLGKDIDGKGPQFWTGLGESISISGNRVAVGSSDAYILRTAGYVRVFEWNDEEWLQLGEDIEGEAIGDASGFSVSSSHEGNRLAIGAHNNHNGNGIYAGHVRVYDWDGTQWTQLEQDIDGEAEYNVSGQSVSLSSDGQKVAIGAPKNDGNGDNSGHVRVYEWNGAEWSQVGEDIDGKRPQAYSGVSVSMSSNGNIVAIGGRTTASNGLNPGYVQVYKWNGTEWKQYGDEIKGEEKQDWSGQSVSISSDGQIVAIGAPKNGGNGQSAGHVRVFDFSNVSTSTQDRKDEIQIFPNPTTGNITMTRMSATTFSVMDHFGREVKKVSSMDQELDLSDLSAGIYYLRINTESGSINRRIIKL